MRGITVTTEGLPQYYAFAPDQNQESAFWSSSDFGTTWELQGEPLPFGLVKDFDVDPFDPSVVYSATAAGVYMYNSGQWTQIAWKGTPGITNENFNGNSSFFPISIVASPLKQGTLFVGLNCVGLGHCQDFIYKTDDYGKTWAPIRLNLESHSNVWSLAIDPLERRLHMSTDHGNYSLKLE